MISSDHTFLFNNLLSRRCPVVNVFKAGSILDPLKFEDFISTLELNSRVLASANFSFNFLCTVSFLCTCLAKFLYAP